MVFGKRTKYCPFSRTWTTMNTGWRSASVSTTRDGGRLSYSLTIVLRPSACVVILCWSSEKTKTSALLNSGIILYFPVTFVWRLAVIYSDLSPSGRSRLVMKLSSPSSCKWTPKIGKRPLRKKTKRKWVAMLINNAPYIKGNSD